MNIKKFKYQDDKYWVDDMPYQVVDGEIKPIAGLPDEKRIETLRNYLKTKK